MAFLALPPPTPTPVRLSTLLAVLVVLAPAAAAQRYCESADFFPIAVSLQAPYNIERYRDIGVNLYCDLSWGPLDDYHLTLLHRYGMYVICGQDSFALAHTDDTLIYGWSMPWDEPDNAQWNASTQQYDSCVHPDIVRNRYLAQKAADPTRPVLLTLGQGVANLDWYGRGPCYRWLDSYPTYNNGYLAACDIGAFDIYPVNSTIAGITDSLWYVAKGMDSLTAWSRGSGKPMWGWIECTRFTGSSAGKPTPAEVTSEVWISLIHGAKGIGYFTHTWDPTYISGAVLLDTPMVARIKDMNAQIHALARVLNSPTLAGFATVRSGNPGVPVDLMAKTCDGYHYIFAVAMRPGDTRATFTAPVEGTVDVLGEQRGIPIAGGRFSDDFSAYGVHLYRIPVSPADAPSAAPPAHPGVVLYPNPASGAVTLAGLAPGAGRHQISLFTTTGKLVLFSETGAQHAELHIGALPPGLYLVQVTNSDGSVVKFLSVH
jgi:hypothetical protein